MTDDRRPARTSSVVAVGAAVVAVGASGPFAPLAFVPGAIGVCGVIVGLGRARRHAFLVGVAALAAAAFVAGLDAPVTAPVVSLVATTVAWNAGETAFDLGRRLGRGTETTRPELVHAAGSVAVGALTASVGYGLYRAVGSGYPFGPILLFLLAAGLLLAALR